MPEASNHLFATYHPYYKEKLGTIKSIYSLFLFWSFFKLILLLSISSDCIVKFATYYPYYKDILVSNLTRIFIYAASCLYFGYWLGSLGNLSTTSLFIHNCGVCTVQSGLVTKNKEPSRTSLYISHPDQLLSFLLGLTLKNAPSNIFMLSNSKYTIMCKWLFSSVTYQIQQSTNKKNKISK